MLDSRFAAITYWRRFLGSKPRVTSSLLEEANQRKVFAIHKVSTMRERFKVIRLLQADEQSYRASHNFLECDPIAAIFLNNLRVIYRYHNSIGMRCARIAWDTCFQSSWELSLAGELWARWLSLSSQLPRRSSDLFSFRVLSCPIEIISNN